EAEIAALSDDGIRQRVHAVKERMVEKRKELMPEILKAREEVGLSTSEQERAKKKRVLKDLKNKISSEFIAEAFAIVREASKRTIGLRHFDVQLIGGMVLHEGKISEMATGEGKTLVATLPASLNALSGDNVHVVTVNDYLARRDAEWMGPIYKFLGLSVGVIQHDMRPEERKKSYACDIVYGTNNEFGFDYLRDNMVIEADDMVQGYPAYAIVDEVDSILVDEARTPLIISGPVDETNDAYINMRPVVEEIVRQQKKQVRDYITKMRVAIDGKKDDEAANYLYLVQKAEPKNREFLDIVLKNIYAKSLLDKAMNNLDSKVMAKEKEDLLEDLFYIFDEKTREATFNARGQKLMKEKFGIEFMIEDIEGKLAEIANSEMPEEERMKQEMELTNMYSDQQRNVESIKQLLKAYILFEKDVEYVVHEGKIVIVDEFTGRMMPGRRFSDGIHEAIEAKEQVEVQRESQTLATITLQNYFRMYDKLAGMTGTAKTEETEFESIYLLPVLQIPTNRPMSRENLPDRIYKTEKEKFEATCNEVAEWHKEGKPVLVGTVSIEKSERLSRILTQRGVKHNVLNAKYHEKEANIIAQAGRLGAVTIATNMAGRGTDILLGGNPEFLARESVNALTIDDPAEKEKAYENFLNEAREQTKKEHEAVVKAGGLHVVGTERHESRRIDNQLRGRSGRQGDPGASRFYLSLEDTLMRIFGSDKIKNVMDKLGMEEGEVIENPLVTGAIRTAQKRVEAQNFEIRKHLLKYDDIMNRQREVIYKRRRAILKGENVKGEVFECLAVGVEAILEGWEENLDAAKVAKDLMMSYAIVVKPDSIGNSSAKEIYDMVLELAEKNYSVREKTLGDERMRYLERMIMLGVIDTNWKEYLREVDDLREGISWRAYGQKDPLIEFQHEAFRLFQDLLMRMDSEIAERIMKISAMEEEQYKRSVRRPGGEVFKHEEFSAMDAIERGEMGSQVSREESGESTPLPMPMPGPKENVTFKREMPKVGRNDACPCGSGKKYKKCCGSNQ
ncbi:MAG TPA: preprotein translocase subunit SecA, partial [Candidatus Omnitrophota bacterium]|nr:preprotein translocase subunit SecA [Candidatus Omnitrophota bacterium]